MSKLPQEAKTDPGTPTYEQLAAEASARYAERDVEEGRDLDDWLDAEARLRQGHESEW